MNQPWDASLPPASSLAIWAYEVARRLAGPCEVSVYGRRTDGRSDVQQDAGVTWRNMPAVQPSWGSKAGERWTRLREASLPYFARSSFHRPYMESIARDVAAQGCDAIHLFNFAHFVPIVRRFNPRARIVLNMQCEWLTQLNRSVISRRLHDAHAIVGCSDYIRDKIRVVYPEHASRCFSVYCGADLDPAARLGNRSPAGGHTRKRLLFVGRLSPEKGLHLLLDAFPKLLDRYPEAELDLVGPEAECPIEFIVKITDDPRVAALSRFYDGRRYRQHLEQQTRELGLQDRVHFHGFQPHTAVADFLRRADVLVMPSLSEALGYPAIEAMAAGVPVVASRVGGLGTTVEDGRTGLLFESGNADALAEALLRMLNDTVLRTTLISEGRVAVAERFRWDHVARNLQAILRGTAGEMGTGSAAGMPDEEDSLECKRACAP